MPVPVASHGEDAIIVNCVHSFPVDLEQALPSPGDQQNASAGTMRQRIAGPSLLAKLIRAHGWSNTPLGPLEDWPASLVSAVNLMLAARFPMIVFWGPDLIQLYNDAQLPILFEKHPRGLGQPARLCWAEAWSEIGQELEAAWRDGASTFHENRCIPLLRNGRLQDTYWTYNYNPIYDETGAIGGVLAIAHETTEMVLAEKSFRESEARSRRILESIGDAVIVTDADASIVRINPVAETLTGWANTEAKGVPLSRVFRIVDQTTREPLESPADRIRRTGTVVDIGNHTALIRRDGTEIQIDDSAAPIRDDDGTMTGIVLVFRDVTREREAAREREALHRRVHEILESTSDAVFMLDRDWRFTYLNDNAAKLIAGGRNLLGRHVWTEFPDAIGRQFLRQYQEAMEQRVTVEFEEYYPAPLDKWFTAHAFPSEEGIAVFFHDVTERRNAEHALRQSEKLAAVGRLASSIAHEINNPLESVTNLLFLARNSGEMGEVHNYIDAAERELRRVSIIANRTLRFHKQSTRPQAISSGELFETVLGVYQGRLLNSRVVVETRMRAQKPVVCFEGEIRQVLNNLVGNAIDAMHPAGGRLLLRSRDATDWKTMRRGVVLTVADTGSGIAPESVRRIFDPFFTTKGIGGSGLGLWISREIVERHHARLAVRSSQKPSRSGTVFSLFVPFEAVMP